MSWSLWLLFFLLTMACGVAIGLGVASLGISSSCAGDVEALEGVADNHGARLRRLEESRDSLRAPGEN